MLHRALIQLALMPLLWPVRRMLLNALLGYEIDRDARIGLSIVVPYRTLRMGAGARIGHLNLVRGMDELVMGRDASISNLNWVYAIPTHFGHLQHEPGRSPGLTMEEGAGITRRHLIDCSAPVTIERFAVVAGHGTQLMTHSVGLLDGKHHSAPIRIGAGSLVGTRSVILGGARLPARSALGAGSTLRAAFVETGKLYSGVPAVAVCDLDENSAFFTRDVAYIG